MDAAGPDRLLERARQELASGSWADARTTLERLLELGPSPEGAFGLGVACWWLGDPEAALAGWEDAYAAGVNARDGVTATFAAVYLCLGYQMSLGNDAVATAWLDRAGHLVEELELRQLRGWVLLCRAYLANDAERPRAAESWAEQAIDLAHASSDVDLELCAASELGTARVGLGRVDEGLAILGEAMARALAGEASELDAVVLIGCRIVTSCSRAVDPTRALKWVRAADDFHRRHGSSHLFATCRTHLGAVLATTGAFEEAERELVAALAVGPRAEPALHVEATASLAELRLAQGRLDDAERSLGGLEGNPAAARAVARLHLARGDHAAAASVLRRRLERLSEESLESAAVHELLASAELASGAVADAIRRAGAVVELGTRMGCDAVVARGSLVLGRALVAAGELGDAHLERALEIFDTLGLALDAARTRVALARARATTEPPVALADAQAAFRSFERMGASRDADEAAALIRALGGRATRSGPKALGSLTKREGEVLALIGEGLGNKEIAERLFITRKTVEHHVGNVLAKLGLSGRSEAAAFAARHLSGDVQR